MNVQSGLKVSVKPIQTKGDKYSIVINMSSDTDNISLSELKDKLDYEFKELEKFGTFQQDSHNIIDIIDSESNINNHVSIYIINNM